MTEGYDPLASVQAAGPPGTISFVYGLPDPDTFPVQGLREAADRVLRERPALALQYGPEQGYGPLIDCLRDKLVREEGLEVARPQVMLAGGSAQALDHICTLFTKPGDAVLVEAPTYHETLQLFRDHKLRPRQVAMGKDGLRVDLLAQGLEALARSGERVRFLYTIPNFQNPSGLTLAAHCRREILELAERYDFLVLEDDVYRELCYDAEVPPSLFALARQIAGPHDSGRRVLRIGSFSKILAPGVRLGWILGPPQLIDGLINSGLRRMGGGANPLMANILATYCQQGSLDSHINLLRRVYLERRDAMLAALKAHMPCDVTWTRPGGGFFVWLTLPTPLRATHVAARAKKAKLLVLAGDPFFAETPTGEHLRLAFSYVTPDEIKEGVGWLAQALEEGA